MNRTLVQSIRLLIMATIWLLPCRLAYADQLLISNVSVVSSERQRILQNAYVLIEDGRIKKVTSSPIKLDKKNQVLNGKGKFLTPGLMDSHVHISSMVGAPQGAAGETPEIQKLKSQYFLQQPRSYLYFGVTQLLDPSNSKKAVADFKNQPIRPDLFHCGAVPVLGGYPTNFVSEAKARETFSYLLDEADPEVTPEKLVAQMVSDGASCVKVFIEDGFGMLRGWPLISKDTVARLRAAAHQHGIPLFAHANAIDMQSLALEMQADVIAHGMWNWNESYGKPGIPDPIKKVLDQIIETGVVFQPTFNVMVGLKGVLIPNVLDDPLYQKVVPADLLSWYQTEPGRWFAREMHRDFGGGPLQRIYAQQDKVIAQGGRVVQYLSQQGHKMVLASDTPSSPTYAAQPGFSTFAELKHMAKIGLSLKEIFAAATINNATNFGLEQDYGTVETGKIANLLLLAQNPLASVEAYNSIEHVILHGQVIERSSLAADSQH